MAHKKQLIVKLFDEYGDDRSIFRYMARKDAENYYIYQAGVNSDGFIVVVCSLEKLTDRKIKSLKKIYKLSDFDSTILDETSFRNYG